LRQSAVCPASTRSRSRRHRMPHDERIACIAVLFTACGSGGTQTPTPVPTPGGAIGGAVRNERWDHRPEGLPVAYVPTPPASGPHYPVWLRWEAYDTAITTSSTVGS